MSCSDEHHDHSHDHGHGHTHEVEDPNGNSLFQFVDIDHMRGLNECVVGSCKGAIKPYDHRLDPEPFVESNEDDAELIIHIPFTEVVRIKSISLVGGGGGTCPATIKVFVNREDIDFSLAADLPSTQTIEAAEQPGTCIDYPTKLSRFGSVSSVTLFVTDNYGGDSSRISYIGFKGESTNFRHGVVEAVYETRGAPEDHKTPGGTFGAHSSNGAC